MVILLCVFNSVGFAQHPIPSTHPIAIGLTNPPQVAGGPGDPPPVYCDFNITNTFVRTDGDCCCITTSVTCDNCTICGFNILYNENGGSGNECSFESNWQSDIEGNSILLNGGPIGPGIPTPLILSMCATFSDDLGFTISLQPFGCNGMDVFDAEEGFYQPIPQCPFVPSNVKPVQVDVQPENLSLGRPYPSPALSEVKFDCNATNGTYLTLTIFGTDGTSIQADDLGFLTEGRHTLTLYTRELKSGKYFASFRAGAELHVMPFTVVE